MQRLSVLFPVALGCYDYLSSKNLKPGTFVSAPLGRKKCVGVVWDKEPDENYPEIKLKKIESVLAEPPLNTQMIRFIKWVAGYTLTPTGAVLKMALNPEMGKVSKKPLIFDEPNPHFTQIDFSSAQQKVVDGLSKMQGFQVALLDGVTGSGKTEVYFEKTAQILEQEHQQILVLLPEIILTTAWLTRFEKRFGVKPALWHSSLTPKQRRDTWEAVRNGTARVIVGARSALFLPFHDLGLIIVDEEHDASFKQEEGVLYHARDMAIVRAKIANCPLILASATPSLETYAHTHQGDYLHFVLPERFAGAQMPDIQTVDMRQKEKGPIQFISKDLQKALGERLDKKEQSLLFLNRRGYAPLMLCRQCGHRLQCPHCSAWLVTHKDSHTLQCHHCGYTLSVPKVCPVCQSENLVACGPGVERVAEEVQNLFPNAHIAQITSETLRNPKDFEQIIDQMNSGEIDILVGTQILAKGHHFANLTLVGVIDADMGLSGGDLRAGERTFQLMQQVMGRAGRESKKGLAILQSYNPENLIIQALQKNDRKTFLTEEMNARQILKMPPFGKLASLIISGKNQNLTYQTIQKIAHHAPTQQGVEVLGPVVAPISKLRGKFRYRLLVKASKLINMQNYLHLWLDGAIIPASVDVRIDIDPYSFF